MSLTSNPDSIQLGAEVTAKIAPEQPMTTKGHQPGVLVGNEKIPDSKLSVHPAGTAPAEHSFHPNLEAAVPGQGGNTDMEPSTRTDPADTLGGTTNADDLKATTSADAVIATSSAGEPKGPASAVEDIPAASERDPVTAEELDREQQMGK